MTFRHDDMSPSTFWAAQLRDQFLPVIRQRGRAYADQGRVLVQTASTRDIRATVHGTQPYEVRIRQTGEDVLLDCSCPFSRKGIACKHLWAVILEADRLLARRAAEPASACEAARPALGWRDLLARTAWTETQKAPPWEGGASAHPFIVRYELFVGPDKAEITVSERYRRRDGGLGRARPLQAATMEHRGLPKADRLIITILDDIVRRRHGNALPPGAARISGRVVPEPRDVEVLVPLLADTGRCRVLHPERGVLADPLRPGVPSAARVGLEVEADAHAGELSARAFLSLGEGEAEIPLADVDAVLRTWPVSVIHRGRLYTLEGPPFAWLQQIQSLSPLRLSQGDLPEFLLSLEAAPWRPVLRIPEALRPKPVHPAPVAALVVDMTGNRLSAELTFDYEGMEVAWQETRATLIDAGRWVQIVRDPDAETACLATLRDLDFKEHGATFARGLAGAAEALRGLAKAGWRILGRGRKEIHSGRVTGLRVTSGIDWFDLSGEVAFGDRTIPLSEAVGAYLRGERLIDIGDGHKGWLPEEWIESHLPPQVLALDPAAGSSPEAVRFSKTQALLLDTLILEKELEDPGEGLRSLIQGMKDFTGLERIPPPAEFLGELRPYQLESLGWLDFLKRFGFGGILADDMGLGKTVQILAWLAREKALGAAGPALVVCPTTLVFNWQAEAARFVPGLRVLAYTGCDRRGLAGDLPGADLVLTTYEILRRDIDTLRRIPFHYAILDESQHIKNADAQVTKAVRVLEASHRLCLTGTPLENHVGELWSQMAFLNPGLLGSRRGFETHFVRPVTQGDEATADHLKRVVRPFILRRTKEAVAPELPEKVRHLIRCPMPPAQARVYEEIKSHYRRTIMDAVDSQGLRRSRFKILEGLLRLRQAANHPALVGAPSGASGKLDELMTLVEEAVAGGHKALIFSQFTKMLALVRQGLDGIKLPYLYLDGRTPRGRRQERVCRFQEDDNVKLFLISLRAGGVGLNLTAADYVFLVDPWWNPAVETQAIDRTHRIGQDKKIFTYQLISAGTVEEKVLDLQQKKSRLATDLLSEADSLAKTLTRQDLETLLA